MRREPSLGRIFGAPLGKQLVHQRTAPAEPAPEPPKRDNRVFGPFDHQFRTIDAKVDLVAGRQTERRTNFGGDYQPALSPNRHCGIHT